MTELGHPRPGHRVRLTGGVAELLDASGAPVGILAEGVEGLFRAGALVLVSNGLRLLAFDAEGPRWKTPRLSWDGLRSIAVASDHVTGEGWDAIDEVWVPFRVALADGRATGGGYEAPCG